MNNTYTTNKKPESKFEDVPEEVLTDPTMRTALGMDPIPGMNTPVDEPRVSTLTTFTTTATPEVKIFKNPVHPEFGEIRTLLIDNEPWFVGKDVCQAFGDTNYRRSLSVVDAYDKGVSQIATPGGKQNMTIINESGLYTLLFQMQPQKAKGVSQNDTLIEEKIQKLHDFKRWVTSEVLPSIRKNGAYIRNQENMTPEQLVAAGLIAAQKIIESKEKEIALLNGRCGLLTQAVDEKQNIIDAISRNVSGETKRMLMNRFLRSKYPELSQGRYGYLYTVFGEVYHMNLKYRFEKYNKEPGHKKCKSMMEYIDEVLGMIDELFDLFVKLYASSFKEFLQSIYITRMTDEEFESEEYWKRVL